MIARVIAWSAHHWGMVLIGIVVLVLLGLFAVSEIPLDAIPDLSDTQVIVYTEYPGQAPQVVEDQVLSADLGAAERAQGEDGTRRLLFRCFLYLHDLR